MTSSAAYMASWIKANPSRWRRIHRKAVAKYNKSPRRKWVMQRYNANKRGIEFDMTFDEWWKLWKPLYNCKGSRSGRYVMARFGDKGPYKVGNVEIILHEENARDSWRNRRE